MTNDKEKALADFLQKPLIFQYFILSIFQYFNLAAPLLPLSVLPLAHHIA